MYTYYLDHAESNDVCFMHIRPLFRELWPTYNWCHPTRTEPLNSCPALLSDPTLFMFCCIRHFDCILLLLFRYD